MRKEILICAMKGKGMMSDRITTKVTAIKKQSNFQELKKSNARLLEEDKKANRYILRAYPTFVGLATDPICNLKCIMCIHRKFTDEVMKSLKCINEKDFINFADQVFPTAKILQLNTAGEPLLSRNFDLELELAIKYQVKLDLCTSGLLLTHNKGRLEKIVRNAANIGFSFDSPVKETYEAIRINSDFLKVMENMRLVQKERMKIPAEKRPSFNITMVLMKRNLHELLRMIYLSKDLGVDHLLVSKVMAHTKDMEKESLHFYQEEVNQTLHEAKDLARKLKLNLVAPSPFGVNNDLPKEKKLHAETSENRSLMKPLQRCMFLWDRVYIDSSSKILVCCEPSHPTAGDIRTQDFKDIWNNDIYQKMRKTFVSDEHYKLCYDCATTGYLT